MGDDACRSGVNGLEPDARRCLAYRQQDRLSVADAAAHPFLVLRQGSRRRSAAPAAPAPAALEAASGVEPAPAAHARSPEAVILD